MFGLGPLEAILVGVLTLLWWGAATLVVVAAWKIVFGGALGPKACPHCSANLHLPRKPDADERA